MIYRLFYSDAPVIRADEGWQHHPVRTEEFKSEHQALRRARELIEAGEHHGVLVDDGAATCCAGCRCSSSLAGFQAIKPTKIGLFILLRGDSSASGAPDPPRLR
jgi:hypothetical protein